MIESDPTMNGEDVSGHDEELRQELIEQMKNQAIQEEVEEQK